MTRRIERVNHLIRQEISELLQRQIKDPRLDSFVTVTEVSTSSDLRSAKVFVSCIGSEAKKEETLRVLTVASGYFRGELAKRLRLRRVPEIDFQWDNSIQQGANILELIDWIHEDESRS
ncbi:MAG: 30S ribosome-binding factor RbfA [Dehalococcoidales bacterium]|jgi:ribosome-binding factor A|nr:30S ribosome-binding factor RbfA [Dehalococcoidales bacterium]